MSTYLSKLEKEYVLDTYTKISDGFSKSRSQAWPSVVEFINTFPINTSMLDAGCGNGKNMIVRDDLKWTGCDICPELLDICRNRNLNVVEADIRYLPFDNNTFDASMSVAVIHHIDTFEGRLKAVDELIRVTKTSGKIFIQVWQDTDLENNKFQKINSHGDYYITWTQNNEIIKRFYHMFKEDEVDRLIDKLVGIKIIKKYIEASNWIILLEKT